MDPVQRFLVGLSHEWTLQVWLSVITLLVVAFRSEKFLARARATGSALLLRQARIRYAISVSLFILSLIVLGLSFLHVGCSYQRGDMTKCLSNIKHIEAEMLLYAQDYDEHLPPAKHWSELISPKLTAGDLFN